MSRHNDDDKNALLCHRVTRQFPKAIACAKQSVLGKVRLALDVPGVWTGEKFRVAIAWTTSARLPAFIFSISRSGTRGEPEIDLPPRNVRSKEIGEHRYRNTRIARITPALKDKVRRVRRGRACEVRICAYLDIGRVVRSNGCHGFGYDRRTRRAGGIPEIVPDRYATGWHRTPDVDEWRARLDVVRQAVHCVVVEPDVVGWRRATRSLGDCGKCCR